jgi:alpha-1,2-mannosyltransferase
MLTREHAASAIRLRLSKLAGPLRGGDGRVLTARGLIVLALLAAPLMAFQVGTADLGVYRHGASAVLHGRSLYAPGFAAATPGHLPFTYPPFAAVAALVLLPLPQTFTAELWGAATVLMLAWCVRVSFGRLLERKPSRADLTLAALTATLLATRPVFDHLGDGQVDILLMTLCLADTLTPRPRWPRGLLVGVATAIKLVPGIFIPYLWITGRRRAAAVAAGTFVICESMAGLATFADSHRYWTSLVFNTERPGYTAGYKNQSLRGILLRLFPAPERSYLLFIAAVVVAIVALAGARSAAFRGNMVAGATLTGLAGVLASPVSWIHATVWILPAIGIIADRRTSPVRVGMALLTTLALIAGLPYWPNIVHGLPHPAAVLLQRSFGLMCVALVLTLPALDRRSPPRAAGADQGPRLLIPDP